MYKGIWLFGTSGSGKSFLSKKIFNKKKKSFIIDGDDLRSLVSFDLGYKLTDRIIQNKRALGIAKMVINNNYFPIISSVYLDPKVYLQAKRNKIRVINILAPKSKINKKLFNKKNVVGKSISQPFIKCEIFENFKKGKKIYV